MKANQSYLNLPLRELRFLVRAGNEAKWRDARECSELKVSVRGRT
jgi:hypothetical protein